MEISWGRVIGLEKSYSCLQSADSIASHSERSIVDDTYCFETNKNNDAVLVNSLGWFKSIMITQGVGPEISRREGGRWSRL